jgi:Zn-dependent protease with chaperone function
MGIGAIFGQTGLTGRKVSFANLFTTHPPTADRIARLRGQRPGG